MCQQCAEDRKLFPDLNDKEYMDVLWSLTCFPMGDPHEQVMEIYARRQEGWTWNQLYERADREMMEALHGQASDCDENRPEHAQGQDGGSGSARSDDVSRRADAPL